MGLLKTSIQRNYGLRLEINKKRASSICWGNLIKVGSVRQIAQTTATSAKLGSYAMFITHKWL